MNKTAILMPSVTHAMKAKKVFGALKLKSEIKRAVNISKSGCTHYITVNTAPWRAIDILDRNNIKHGEVMEESDGSW